MAFSIWVGGGEVNDHLVTLSEAREVADHWINQGYDDVAIVEYGDGMPRSHSTKT